MKMMRSFTPFNEERRKEIVSRLNIETYPVYQYSLSGDFIAEYSCAGEAARILKQECLTQTIGRCIQGKATQSCGFQWSKEKVEKMNAIPFPHSLLVKCIETERTFHSIREAAREYQIKTPGNISAVCKGKRQTAGEFNGQKLHWKYIE